MPKIKHQFTSGKMNKDVDERLVPKGEYRDAMNIQVSTSEGSDVGTVQNILGNRKINSCTIPELKEHCVASIADEKNDVGYYLIASSNKFMEWNGTDAIISPSVSAEIVGIQDVFGGHNSSYNALPQVRLMMNSYINPNTHPHNLLDRPGVGDNVAIVNMMHGGISSSTTVTAVDTSVSGNNGPDTIDSYIITLSETPVIHEPWLWSGSEFGYFPVQVSFNKPPKGTPDLCSDVLKHGYQLQRDMIVKFDGNSTTPVFVDPYLKTFFATCDRAWPTDPFSTGQDSLVEFEFICEGNPYNVEVNDIITGIETNGQRFENLNIKIAKIEEHSFHFQLADIPKDIRSYLTTQPMRFVVGGEDHRVLNFNKDRLITGINIVDNMLFWTDNTTEPKKINIDRSIQGTHNSCLLSTKLIADSDNITHHPNSLYGFFSTPTYGNIACKEEHITVIKKSPTSTLWVTTQDITELTTGIVGTWSDLMGMPSHEQFYAAAGLSGPTAVIQQGDFIDLNLYPTNEHFLAVDDIIVFDSVPGQGISPSEEYFKLKAKIDSQVDTDKWKLQVLSVEPGFNMGDYYAWSEIFKPEESDTFKNKFPRFSYRYKYEDGEYSCFAPFTNPIFTPGTFSYEPKKAYNLGMENTIRKITLSGYKNNIPEDVVQVDLLYKESNSPLVYLIDNIKPSPDNPSKWELSSAINFHMLPHVGGFDVSPNIIRATLPSNQSLRPWDNVPRLALAQEITGNRIVYANYLQNYNVNNVPSLKVELVNGNNYSNLYTLPLSHRYKSLKSMRNYSLGISYLDKYNRQSPVFSSDQSEISIPINKSKNWNKAKITPLTVAPDWATHCKVFVKDTSNEYYNLAMDRIYDAKDGNVWISFNSSDRNKITDETFLILKKDFEGTGSNNGAVLEKNRYKILAIENEAPDFIKTRTVLAAQSGGAPEDIFTDPSYLPKPSASRIKIDYSHWNSFEIPLMDLEKPLAVAFLTVDSSGSSLATEHYDVVSLHDNADNDPQNPVGATHYDIKLSTSIKETWINQSPIAPGADINEILQPSLQIRVYRNIIENKPEFDGRFFVKIERDPIIDDKVFSQLTNSLTTEYVASVSIPFNFMSDGQNTENHPQTTANIKTNERKEWEDELDRLNGVGKSGWFIDAASYKGEYDLQDLNKIGMLWLNDWTDLSDSTDPLLPNFVKDTPGPYAHYKGKSALGQERYYGHGLWPSREERAQTLGTNGSPRKNTKGCNKGIYEEGGKFYMDLAYSRIGHDLVEYNEYETVDGGSENVTGQWHHYHWDSEIAFNIHPVEGIHQWPWGLPGRPDDDNSWTYQTGIVEGENTDGSCATCNPYVVRWNPNAPSADPVQAYDNPNYSHYANDTFSGAGTTDGRYRDIDFYQKLSQVEMSPISGLDMGLNWWQIGSLSLNPGEGDDQIDERISIEVNAKFKFITAAPDDIIYTILSVEEKKFVNHTNSEDVQDKWDQAGHELNISAGQYTQGQWDSSPKIDTYISKLYAFCAREGEENAYTGEKATGELGRMGLTTNRRTVYKIQLDMDPRNPNPQTNINGEVVSGHVNPLDVTDMDTKSEIQFLRPQTVYSAGDEELSSRNPAVWETEQKSDNDLDIYYEVDDTFPLEINNDTNYDFAPRGSTFTPNSHIEAGAKKYTILEWADNRCRLDDKLIPSHPNSWYNSNKKWIDFLRPNGSIVKGRYRGVANPIDSDGGSKWIIIDKDVSRLPITLAWHNCYSFGNGVESDRIRDDFNQVRIDKGAKASTTLDEPYKEEHRRTGLIHSGLYNSNSGVNNLNQFIQAEKITKDINPIYGSIQKLHSRDTDLVTLCEDKCLRILSNKDAVFNADGNPQLTANENVLGQTIPFSGEYGISTNPESFASESYRVYFTDRVRGTVLRLSKDGLTPISMYGMKDWFKDNLKLSNIIIGSYDDKKDEYNITLKNNYREPIDVEIESKIYDEDSDPGSNSNSNPAPPSSPPSSPPPVPGSTGGSGFGGGFNY